MQEISKEIYDKYAINRCRLHEEFKSLPKNNRDFFISSLFYNAMVGDLGETIVRNKLVEEGYKIYCAENSFFFIKSYDDILLPKSFLNHIDIKKYQHIDRYIQECYDVSGIESRLPIRFYRKELNKRDAMLLEAKRLNVKKSKDYWDRHPGKIDIVAEKNGAIAFFEIKTNSSQLSDWQKLRILLLQRENIVAKVIRVHLNFSYISENSIREYNVVRVPFKKKFAFGILFGKQNPTSKNLYSVQIPESIKEITIQVKSSEIEKVDYTFEFEEVKKLKIVEIPDKQYMEDIHQLFISFYGNRPDSGYLEY